MTKILHGIGPSTDLCGTPFLHSLYYFFKTTFSVVGIDTLFSILNCTNGTESRKTSHILLQKLHAIGFFKHSVNCFQFYLINKLFLINLGNRFTKPACVSRNVPQECIFGPLFFPIYINDMSKTVKCDLFLTLKMQVWLINIKILIKLKNN